MADVARRRARGRRVRAFGGTHLSTGDVHVDRRALVSRAARREERRAFSPATCAGRARLSSMRSPSSSASEARPEPAFTTPTPKRSAGATGRSSRRSSRWRKPRERKGSRALGRHVPVHRGRDDDARHLSALVSRRRPRPAPRTPRMNGETRAYPGEHRDGLAELASLARRWMAAQSRQSGRLGPHPGLERRARIGTARPRE